MTNNTRNAIYACLLLLAITVGACVKDSTVPESIHKQPQDFRLADARKHYEENIEHLCFPEIYLKPIIQTKGSSYFHNLEQTPLWDRFHFSENGWSYIYEIPILYNITLKASMGYLIQDGHLIKDDQDVKLQSNLIIQKYKESGNVHIFLSTVVGYISNPDAEIHGVSPWLWTGDRKNFTGYQFFTNPDGSFKGAFQYRNSQRTSIILDIYNKEYEYIYPQEAFTIRFGPIVTKGNEMEEDQKYCDDCQKIFDSEESNCPQCGSWLMDLNEIIVTPQPDPQPKRCTECNYLIEDCVCNNDVNECPNCGLPHCSGECMNIGGDGTVSGGTEVPNNPTYYLISASVNPVNAGNIYGTGIYKAGSDVTLTVTGNQNYIFAYWKGDLSGSNHSSTFKASKDIDATAVFFHKDSACGKLLRNYNQNILLKESVEQINNIVTDTTKNKIEYGYYPFNNTLEYVIGTSSGVKIPNNKGVLDFFTHNHPSNILIPSIEDIIGLYRCYKNSRFSNNSKLILATISGTLAIEIFDIHLLESFLADWALLSTSEEELSTYCKAYHQMFNDEVLGNPTASQKQELSCTEMAIDYYMQYGLKFLHRFSSEPSNEWFYASWDEGGKIRFENCLNN